MAALDHAVYDRRRRHCLSAFATAAASTGAAELPKLDRIYEKSAAASAGFIHPNCSI